MKKSNKLFKNICKTVAVMGLGLVMAVSATVPALANTSNNTAATAPISTAEAEAENFSRGITPIAAPARRGAIGLTITGQIPRAATGNREFDQLLNQRFLSQVNEFVDEHMGRAPTLQFSKDVLVSGVYVSVTMDMTAVSATTFRARATTVINTQTLEIVSLNDFNPNVLHLVNHRLLTSAAHNPRLFVTNFAGIDNYHPFYLDGDVLVIPFASGTLNPGNREIVLQNFSLSALQNEIIEDDLFVILDEDQYNTVMVRVTPVASLFGFTSAWAAATRTVTLEMGDFETHVTVGENAHGLELAPEVRGGLVYVPLSFFTEVLGIATTALSDEEIMLTRYRGFDQ